MTAHNVFAIYKNPDGQDDGGEDAGLEGLRGNHKDGGLLFHELHTEAEQYAGKAKSAKHRRTDVAWFIEVIAEQPGGDKDDRKDGGKACAGDAEDEDKGCEFAADRLKELDHFYGVIEF